MGTRGRKTQKGKREPNGKLSRKPEDVLERVLEQVDREVRETLMTALGARVRVFGVDPANCMDQRAGSFVGRLRMSRELSQPQYEAAMKWLESCEEHSWAINAPKRPNAMDLNRVHGNPTAPENVDRLARIMARHKAAKAAIQAVQNTMGAHAHLFGALQYLVEQDVELNHLVGDLRVALNVLARHYGMEERVAAE